MGVAPMGPNLQVLNGNRAIVHFVAHVAHICPSALPLTETYVRVSVQRLFLLQTS